MADARLIQHVKGNNRTIEVQVTDSAGKPYDLPGAVLHFTVKKIETDSVATFALDTSDSAKGTIKSAAAGLVEFYIIPSNTNTLTAPSTFRYDVQMVVASKVYTVIPSSPFELLPSVR